jgi:acyl carrier protein
MTMPTRPTAKTIAAAFRSLLEAQLDRPVELQDSTQFAEDLGLDSVDAVIFLGAIEEKFGIDLPLTNFDHVSTVGELREHLDDELAKIG